MRSRWVHRTHTIDTVPLSVYWSLGPKPGDEKEIDRPSWRDIPLDGIRRADEFVRVMERWFASDKHATARARLHECCAHGNQFNIDRLVAAANLFDLTDPMPPAELPDTLVTASSECLRILRNLPQSEDRDSAIQAISRIGTPTLMKKVLSRAKVLPHCFQLEGLDKVLRQAVLCRNYFVHGPGDTRFDYRAVEPHTTFLTETLEFVFAAAELIECGWNAPNWRLRPHTGHHWFARFVSEYKLASEELLSDLQRGKKSKKP